MNIAAHKKRAHKKSLLVSRRLFLRADDEPRAWSLHPQTYPGRDLNPYSHHWLLDFKSSASTDSATRADTNKKSLLVSRRLFLRADDETRTRDLNLGKVALYQLSYIRIKINVSKDIF